MVNPRDIAGERRRRRSKKSHKGSLDHDKLAKLTAETSRIVLV